MMLEGRSRLQIGMYVGTALLLLGGFALFSAVPDPETIEAAGEQAARRPVETLRVTPVTMRSAAEVSGVLEARRSVDLFAETRGPVVELGAEELDLVEEGQLLVRIDPLLAEVALERAEAAVTRTRSQLALARSNLERRRSLAGRGVASESTLEDAENAEKVAEAALREARAERVRARDDLTKKTIQAPFTGVLRRFAAEVGEYVSEGQELGQLLDLETARVTIGLSDREVVTVRRGQPVEVRVEAYPEESFEGEILRVGAASDPDSRKFPVEVELANAERRMLPGMVVRVSIDLGTSEPRTLVPRDATLDEFGLRFVYVIESNGSAGDLVARRRRVSVRSIPFRPADFEVLAGLEPGEEIAVTATRQLRDGEGVRREGTGGSE